MKLADRIMLFILASFAIATLVWGHYWQQRCKDAGGVYVTTPGLEPNKCIRVVEAMPVKP